MTHAIRRILRDSRGATAVEYGLIAALIVVGIMGALTSFGSATIDMWNNVAATVVAN
jgi:pilus assembly protein Flp/PilA